MTASFVAICGLCMRYRRPRLGREQHFSPDPQAFQVGTRSSSVNVGEWLYGTSVTQTRDTRGTGTSNWRLATGSLESPLLVDMGWRGEMAGLLSRFRAEWNRWNDSGLLLEQPQQSYHKTWPN
jgi:hypothetical protein